MNTIRVYLKALIEIGNDLNTDVIATKIQKIFFLLQKEGIKDLGLKFEPWLFGPYSKELNDTLIELVEKGEVEEIAEPIIDPITNEVIGYQRKYILKDKVNLSQIEPEVVEFFKKWVVKSRRELLKYVYTRYPKYADYSVIKDKVLGLK
ncbi:hypothetical protein SJAV_21680 [Sulfurisphaera javensis]|uniref:Conjugal transfer protein n=1 Tax=Sulfurisphaera javensis TaxID=2049879 RepID=A0AAT9GTK8_9CREN